MGVNLWNSNVSTPTLPLQGGELARGPDVFSNGLSGLNLQGVTAGDQLLNTAFITAII